MQHREQDLEGHGEPFETMIQVLLEYSPVRERCEDLGENAEDLYNNNFNDLDRPEKLEMFSLAQKRLRIYQEKHWQKGQL